MREEMFKVDRIALLLCVVLLGFCIYGGINMPFRDDIFNGMPSWLKIPICVGPFILFTLPAKYGKCISPFDPFFGKENSFLRRLFTIVPPLKLMGVYTLLGSVVCLLTATIYGRLSALGAEFFFGITAGVACLWAHYIYVKRGVPSA
jgi:hypothetical protein